MEQRILIFVNSLAGGGAERVAVNLSTYFSKSDTAVTVVTLKDSSFDFYFLPAGVKRGSLALEQRDQGFGIIWNTIRRVKALRNVIRQVNPSHIIAISTIPNIIAILAGMGLGVKVIVSERTCLGVARRIGPWSIMRKIFYRYADIHVAQTDQAAVWLKKNTAAKNITVIPNAVCWPLPVYDPVKTSSDIVPSGMKVLLAVGSLQRVKGHDLLIEAFSRVAEMFNQWVLVIVGNDAGEGGKLRRLVDQKQLSQRVCFAGKVGNVGDWYSRADLFVLPSRREGFPNTLLEAMAAGCPCVSFDCDTGPREIIQNEVNGVLVSSEDVDALTMSLNRLMGDDELRRRLSENATRVRSTFSQERIMSQWQDLLKAL